VAPEDLPAQATLRPVALLHWLARSRPRRPVENPEPFKAYIAGPPMPGDTHPLFLSLVYAECEARWNQRPPFELVQAGQTEKQPEDDPFHFPPGGQAYQDRCLDVLRWLHEVGEILELKIEDDRDEVASPDR
jgi:hypothetical protein